MSGRELIQECKKYKTVTMRKAVYCRYDYFLSITIRYRNPTQFILFNLIQFNTQPVALYQTVRVAIGRGGSSVITVTGIQAGGYQARKGGFCLFLSLQIGTEAHIRFF
jgi:hypothetical protein